MSQIALTFDPEPALSASCPPLHTIYQLGGCAPLYTMHPTLSNSKVLPDPGYLKFLIFLSRQTPSTHVKNQVTVLFNQKIPDIKNLPTIEDWCKCIIKCIICYLCSISYISFLQGNEL